MSSDNDSKNSNSKNTNDDWEFEVKDLKIESREKSIKSEASKVSSKVVREQRLTVDFKTATKAKTREQLYNELESYTKVEEDVVETAPLQKRFLACIIDVILAVVLFGLSHILAPIFLSLANFVFLKKHYVWIVKPNYLEPIFVCLIFGFFLFFFFFVLNFFQNYTVGKKIMKLRVRGEQQYILTFEQVLYREFILKPITGFLLIGIFYPFFNKEHRAIHDLITKTYVINE